MTYEGLYRWGREELLSAEITEAQLDARLLLESVCGTGRNDLLVHGDREVDSEKQNAYERLIAGRKARIPLQQLTGVQEFMGLEFLVDEHVLIPRQDTEILVEEVLKNLYDGMRILDLCTGSGCILISLLHYSNDCEGVGGSGGFCRNRGGGCPGAGLRRGRRCRCGRPGREDFFCTGRFV